MLAMALCQLGHLLVTAFLLSTYSTTSDAQLANNTQPEVTISQGTLLGTILTTRHGRNISSFLGIPFAQPPIGNLRFANPIVADPWNGTLDATVDPSVCPQISGDVILGDEDCLYLNVYTPQLPENTNSSLLPVMVYIHGGAFKEESQLSTIAGPQYLLDDADVVFVAPSYRLGPLGFLSTGDEIASGNWGLKDLVMALEWVRDNVRYFGGDPDQVTIFGESAGAGCIHLLTLSDTTIGLFHKYVTQSGSALAPWAHRPRAAYASKAYELGEFVGCNNETSDSLVSCLRTISFSDIIATDTKFKVWEYLPDIMWGPTDEPDIEGAFMTESPTNLFAAGKIRDLPWMCGVVRDEGLIFSTAMYADEKVSNDFMEKIDTILPIMLFWEYQSDSGAAWTKAAKSYYLNDLTSNRTELLKNLTMLFGDSHFWYPLRNALQQQHLLAVNPQYFYTLDYRGSISHTWIYARTTADLGVAHADDLLYIFPKEEKFWDLNATMSERDYEVAESVVQLWTSFAINGKPTATALGDATWEPYSAEDNYLRIGNDSDVALQVQSCFYKERMEFWANINAATESQDDSGAGTLYSNSVILLLVACSNFILSAATADRLG